MATTASTSSTSAAQAQWLAQRIMAHKEEVARLREEIGDPQQALYRFLTERFEARALVPDEGSDRSDEMSFRHDDDLDAR
jgi:hypothetical protein